MEEEKQELSLLRKILKVATEGLPESSDPELAKARRIQKKLRVKAKDRPSRSVRSPGRAVSKQLEELEKD